MQDLVVAPPKLQLVQSPAPTVAPADGSTDLDAEIDETLAATFPASDPTPWWAGPPEVA